MGISGAGAEDSMHVHSVHVDASLVVVLANAEVPVVFHVEESGGRKCLHVLKTVVSSVHATRTQVGGADGIDEDCIALHISQMPHVVQPVIADQYQSSRSEE
jgi:hypothetical protein